MTDSRPLWSRGCDESYLSIHHGRVGNEKAELTVASTGPVTDYGSTMVHWMRYRQPRYKGGYQGEVERPSPSYIIDVSRRLTTTFPSSYD